MVVIALLVLIAVVSVVLASLKVGGGRTTTALLALHVVASVALIATLEGPLNLWIITLGPGLLVAAIRLVTTLARSGRARGAAGGPG
ncbi:hypothetical protein KCV87_32715 [Actinosynnema pretiosum subsp. pretiosum]|uniref:Uncharacterized protein n=1 Tax=Actinosynnema pretiosum subsp. pretiosum TaxID=103721 RepID=A0AA45L6P2_9PSEU|nr:hypothetical protein APASM_4597 [Actinosynnema pretiosum subsp. pretiosum]QUF04058.1 hypothetical protein KCV87_32715 [Actinosynnema pretiosum subsp. pretiosum]